MPTEPSRLADILRRPATWHYASLAICLAFLLYLGSTQWFFYDEWAFLIPQPVGGLFAPHVGHWSTSPILITQALRAVFGLSTYLPYVGLLIVVHLTLAHLLWRLMNRVGVAGWLATSLAALFMLLGAGAENLLWAFQIGFVGAMALGVAVVLILDRPDLGRGATIAVIALSVWSLTFSGTAVPVLIAGGLVSLARRGMLRTLALLGPSAVVYAVWYLTVQLPSGSGSRFAVSSLDELMVDSPRFFGHFFVDGLGAVLPFPFMGAIAVFALLVWALRTVPAWRGPATAAYALAGAAIIQGVLVSVSRVQLGTESASAGRYVYALVALLLPAIGLAFGWFARGRATIVIVLSALTVLVLVYNVGLLVRDTQSQVARETETQAQVYAALDIVTAPGADFPADAQPMPDFAPDLTVGDLIAMYDAGWITRGAYPAETADGIREALENWTP